MTVKLEPHWPTDCASKRRAQTLDDLSARRLFKKFAVGLGGLLSRTFAQCDHDCHCAEPPGLVKERRGEAVVQNKTGPFLLHFLFLLLA